MQLGERQGRQEGRQNTLSALVKKGLISEKQANEMLN